MREHTLQHVTEQVRVMTFNVRGSFRDVGKTNAWDARAAMNVGTIRRCGPALVGLQECQRGNLKTYEEELPEYARLRGPRYGNRRPHDFNAILYDPAALEALETGGFWLSETPDRYSKSWETRVARSANWAIFRPGESGAPFLHLNTHLDHRSKPARLEASRLILDKLREIRAGRKRLPTIVTGDFNSVPGSPSHRTFLDAGFADAHLATGNEDTEDTHTFHSFKGSRYVPRRGPSPKRLDWILLQDPGGKARVTSCVVVRSGDEEAGVYPSDHYPVVADVRL